MVVRFCPYLLLAVAGLFSAVSAAQTHADTVWMKNGDRLSGELRQLDAKTLTLHTPYGEMVLPWQQVQRVESEAALPLEHPADLTTAASDTQTVDADPFPTAVSVRLARPWVPRAVWLGSLDLGFNYKTASTRNADYAATLDTEVRHASWRHNIYANYLRKIDNDRTSTHLFNGNLASDRFLTHQFFWQGRARYKWDQIEEVSRQTALGMGPGYQFWDNEHGALSLSGLLGRLRYDYDDGYADAFYAGSLRWDYKRYFLEGNRLELYTTGEFTRSLNGRSNLNLDAVVGMRYRMTDWLSWFLSYSRNQIKGGREDLNEKRISTGLGVTW